jgi:hypothetical protein
MADALGKHMVIKRYIKKNGEEVVKQYDQTKYNKNFYEKHKDELCEKRLCECGKEYTHGNISHHIKSQYHLLYKRLTPPTPPPPIII